jgi:hypothetical protein
MTILMILIPESDAYYAFRDTDVEGLRRPSPKETREGDVSPERCGDETGFVVDTYENHIFQGPAPPRFQMAL